MDIKQRAAWDVARMLAVGCLAGLAVTLAIGYFGLAATGIAVSTAMLIWLIKMAYDVRVDQLEYQQQRSTRSDR